MDAGDVAEVLGAGAHLVGHSYGGVVALLAAARRPEAVRSLAVIEPPAFALAAGDGAVQAFIARVQGLLAAGLTPAQFLPRFVEAVGGDPGRLPRPLPPPLIRAASVQMHGRWPWEADVPLEALAAAPFPKLVLSGGHSRLFDVICDALEAALPAERAVLPGAGHGIPALGQPVNERLAAFWDRAGPGG